MTKTDSDPQIRLGNITKEIEAIKAKIDDETTKVIQAINEESENKQIDMTGRCQMHSALDEHMLYMDIAIKELHTSQKKLDESLTQLQRIWDSNNPERVIQVK